MNAARERMTIGEKIHTNYKVIVVALPESNDEYVTVCPVIFSILGGVVYYDDNTIEEFNPMLMEIEAIEKAKSFMPKSTRDCKMTITYAWNDYYHTGEAKKANEKLMKKLQGMTKWEFYNNKR